MHLPDEGTSETPLEVLLRLANEHPGRRPEFYQRLLDSPIVVASLGGSDGQTQLAALLTPEGEQVIPFFTSLRTLRQTFPAVPYCASLTVRQLFENAPDRPFHLNPGSTFGRTFTADEVASLLSTGMITRAVAEPLALEGIEVTELAAPPWALIVALTDLYSRTPEVEAAFLAHIGGQGAALEKRLLVALEMKAPKERVVHDTATVVRDVDEVQHFLVDVIVFDLKPDSAWAEEFRLKVKPFYQSDWGSRMLSANLGRPS